MSLHKYRNVPPRASALLESLRGMGYSIETAIADVIDNSISAQAENISITFHWAHNQSYIAILDDGNGMNEANLEKAMKLGEISAISKRKEDDLGRFGLGLKTASFSQCRSLTVSSITKESGFQCFRWDLDLLASQTDGSWLLIEGPIEQDKFKQEPLIKQNRGTLVLWDRLDRAFPSNITEQYFLDAIDSVQKHLSMIFHRFIEDADISISINNHKISSWDPFAKGHLAKTWATSSTKLVNGNGARIECHVLPKLEMLTTKEAKELEGVNGWKEHQGFYVYRNKRLLVPGSWLRLGDSHQWKQDDINSLVRIQLDIGNLCDEEWKVDIIKSKVTPPHSIRESLVRYASEARKRAQQTNKRNITRNLNISELTQASIWNCTSDNHYVIDRQHVAVVALNEQLSNIAPLSLLLSLIEKQRPIQRMWVNEPSEELKAKPISEPSREMHELLKVMYKNMISRKGMSHSEAIRKLNETSPFQQYPELISKLEET
ncbi:ATP-binding protein [Shewanella sp. 10N.261.52.F9]|uniref:ATP-binding protein n=1 Tax=Shewanella sp. 10N.261.52.F9 TaxID=3229684 RepID=UPI00354E737A